MNIALITATIIGALIIGLSLGLLGAGGSILTVPVLVYAIALEEKAAIASAMFIVGAISIFSATKKHQQSPISFSTVFLFALSSSPGAVVGSYIATYLSGDVQLVMLSIVMVFAGIRMLSGSSLQHKASQVNRKRLFIIGSSLGLLTGVVGIGGGFLIVPALTLYAGIAMSQAVTMSLFIITLNCVTGFISYSFMEPNLNIPWLIVFAFALVGIAGSVFGSLIFNRLSQKTTKSIFAYALIIGAVTMGAGEVWQLLS
ncbi:MAG: TSUP family transporter [Alteromonadaceae bacterium]|nr:TSUP family transporter [Alteromonadaceae bacterium]